MIIEYSFSEKNKKTLVFLPGYSDGLDVYLIKELVKKFSNEDNYNVFGIKLNFKQDIQDVFSESQQDLVNSVIEIYNKTPNTEIVLIAKSLSGSLVLANSKKLPVNGIIILGSSIVLGWPQRISILQSQHPTIPDYKSEWFNILSDIDLQTLILSGDLDDLSDNDYLAKMVEKNRNLHLVVLQESDHNLMNTKNTNLNIESIFQNIEKFKK